jgi:intracellular sulfur oxidation DsrE/DsrF family protein
MHRQVYDVVTPAGGIGIAFARNFLTANVEGYGLADRDVSVVVSLRHSGIAYAFGDAMWTKHRFGETFDIAEQGGPAAGGRNPHAALITSLQKRGVVFTVCGMALRRRASEAAQRTGGSADAMREEWRSGLLPDVIEVVAGVIAVNRAQERGFSYVYAG